MTTVSDVLSAESTMNKKPQCPQVRIMELEEENERLREAASTVVHKRSSMLHQAQYVKAYFYWEPVSAAIDELKKVLDN